MISSKLISIGLILCLVSGTSAWVDERFKPAVEIAKNITVFIIGISLIAFGVILIGV